MEGYYLDPDPADMVCMLDVAEHIEPECLDAVLRHFASKCIKAAVVTIALKPALKHLPDGRNAHLIVQPAHWWMEKFSAHFDIIRFYGDDEHVILEMTPCAEEA